MVSINNISIRFGGFELFSDVGFMINKRDRIGLVGKNGAGKSTLLKVICKQIQPNEGNISCPADISIGYLPQQMPLIKSSITVFEETKNAFNEVLDIQLNFIEAEIEKVLKGLGFSRNDQQRKLSEFSGGWRMRVELAKILLRNNDIILLDEPTNHLDIEAIQWLEEFLETYKGAVLVISHDRAFLDNTTNRTIEINFGKIYDYKVSYSQFKTLQRERMEQQLAAYENQQKLINDTEKFIERFRYKATKANQVQSRIKQLEKLDRIEIDDLDSLSMNIKFQPAPRSGDIVIKTDELSKSYGEKNILKNIDFVLERGEKIAFVGRNGEGKTTLARVIVGELDYEGLLKIGHNVKIGYFAQNQDELLNPELTVFETLDNVAVGDIRSKIRDILGAFLFSGEDIDKKVKILSGGEHSRLSLAKLLLEPYNLLILDEPTNHLDMRSKDTLKQVLKKFDGTLIIVSHDRDFLDGLVEKIYEFKDKKMYQHIGGIHDFLRRRKLRNMQELEMNTQTKNNNTGIVSSQENKLNYEARKEYSKKLRKAEKEVEGIEKQITTLEFELSEMNKQLEQPEKASDSNFIIHYQKRQKELEQLMNKWEILCNVVKDIEKPL